MVKITKNISYRHEHLSTEILSQNTWQIEKRNFEKILNALYWGNEIPTIMYDIPKNSEKWVESKYEKIERLDIVPGTWSAKRLDAGISKLFLHDILYTIRFVKMRRIQRYHFHYVKCVGRRPPQENTVLAFWHYINDVIFWKSMHTVKWFQNLVLMVLVSC